MHRQLLTRPSGLTILVMIDTFYKINIRDRVVYQNTVRIINYLDHLLFEIKIKRRRFGGKIGLVVRQNSKYTPTVLGPTRKKKNFGPGFRVSLSKGPK